MAETKVRPLVLRALAAVLAIAAVAVQAPAQAAVSGPHVSYAVKAHPPGRAAPQDGSCSGGSCFYYAGMAYDGISAAGASVSITQNQPAVAAADFHSLAELAVESADGQQIVEVGWVVAQDINGDSLTHLFVYHWVNGQTTCYNGCGFVPVSKKYTAGGLVQVGATGTYAIHYSVGKWILRYDGVELGYFPGSLWSGSFTSIGIAQAFGEVASSSSTTPQSQMGNGLPGSNTKSAQFTTFSLTSATAKAAADYYALGAPSVYTIGHYSDTCQNACHLHFGGPGY